MAWSAAAEANIANIACLAHLTEHVGTLVNEEELVRLDENNAQRFNTLVSDYLQAKGFPAGAL